MAELLPPTALVVMPGTGSDADYVRRAFGSASTMLDVTLITLDPTARLVDDYVAALDDAAHRYGRILVGGVSIGASIATSWAIRNESRCAGILAALPPWTGEPGDSIASASASATAAALRRDGLDATVEAMRAGSPPWLAAELTRSWRRLFPDLIVQLDEAASFVGPTLAELATVCVPLAVCASLDDVIHPIDVARAWTRTARRAVLCELRLADWGGNAPLLGETCARGWLELTSGRGVD